MSNPAESNRPQGKFVWLVLIAVLFVIAGALHFFRPAFYLTIMPPYLPWPMGLIYLSGVFEILGGIGLLLPGVRRLSGFGLMALLLAVLPANAQMLVQDLREHAFLVDHGDFDPAIATAICVHGDCQSRQ